MKTDTPARDAIHKLNAPLPVHFIRRGETAWSLFERHTGRTDLPLTAHGESMAQGLAITLHDIPFSLVLTSPRLRARSTCTLAGLGAAAQVEPSLAEWDYGDYEGRRTAEIREHHPAWDVWADGCPHGAFRVRPGDVALDAAAGAGGAGL